MPVAGVIVFPFCEVRLTVVFFNGFPAESLTLKVSGTVLPNARELSPLIVIVVPVTSTLLVAVTDSAVALTVIERFVLLPPTLSLAVTKPFASDTPLALMLFMNAVTSFPAENVTVLPLMVCLLALSTIAVRSTVFVPAEATCVLLASS